MVKGDAPLSGEHKFFHMVKYNLAIQNQLNESVTRGSDDVLHSTLQESVKQQGLGRKDGKNSAKLIPPATSNEV